MEHFDLIGKRVRIELDTGLKYSGRFVEGNLVTVDPTSETVVLAKLGGDYEVQSFEMIPKCSITEMVKVESEENENEEVLKKINENIEKILNGGTKVEGKEDEQTIKERCQKIIDYLKSHHIDVVEKQEGIFEICGIVRFERPYSRDNFYCDIPLVLQRIFKLVDQI